MSNMVWRPISAPGYGGDDVAEGWLLHFEKHVESGLTDADDIQAGWGLGFIQGLAAAFGELVTPEQAARFAAVVRRMEADHAQRRARKGGTND